MFANSRIFAEQHVNQQKNAAQSLSIFAPPIAQNILLAQYKLVPAHNHPVPFEA